MWLPKAYRASAVRCFNLSEAKPVPTKIFPLLWPLQPTSAGNFSGKEGGLVNHPNFRINLKPMIFL